MFLLIDLSRPFSLSPLLPCTPQPTFHNLFFTKKLPAFRLEICNLVVEHTCLMYTAQRKDLKGDT